MLSDRFDEECEAIVREGGNAEDCDEHGFFVPPREMQNLSRAVRVAASGDCCRVTHNR